MERINKLRLYTVDFDYLKYLYPIDQEVYFNDDYEKLYKPFIGILYTVNNQMYVIPFTSIKDKHKKWSMSQSFNSFMSIFFLFDFKSFFVIIICSFLSFFYLFVFF